MTSARIRQSAAILPRVEDLERSHQWAGLACDIGDLERLTSRSRGSPVSLENSLRPRSSPYRRSMPAEVAKPDLVYVRITSGEDLRSAPSNEEKNRRGESKPGGVVDRYSWKPRTEFERNYFGIESSTIEEPIDNRRSIINTSTNYSPIHPGILNTKTQQDQRVQSSSPGYYRNVDVVDVVDFDIKDRNRLENYDDVGRAQRLGNCRPRSSGFGCYSETNIPGYSDGNERRKTCSGVSFYYDDSRPANGDVEPSSLNGPEIDRTRSFLRRPQDTEHRSSVPEPRLGLQTGKTAASRRPDDGDSEYRGSRERLHEIFEHNRQLRRKFFATMPGGTDPQSLEHQDPLRGVPSEGSTTKSRLDFQKPGGSGFGSTETLTSQSNQSGASSTNGRKSRVDFGVSPEPPEDSGIFNPGKVDSRMFNSQKVDSGIFNPGKVDSRRFGFGGSSDASRVEVDPASFSYSRLPLPSKPPVLDRLNSCDDTESATHDDDEEARKTCSDRLKESPIDTSSEFSRHQTIQAPGGNRRRTDSVESDHKFFATFVHVQDSSGSSSKVSTPTDDKTGRKIRIVPPPLDLSSVHRRFDPRYEKERRLLKNYSVEVTPLRDFDRPTKGSLTVLQSDDSASTKTFEPYDTSGKSLLRGSKSLLDLPGNLSKSFKTGLTRMTKSDDSSNASNVLNSGWASTVGDLRSPQLVNSFSNSMIDLLHPTDHDSAQRSVNSLVGHTRRSCQLEEPRRQELREVEEDEDTSTGLRDDCSPDSGRRKSIGSTTPGTGTTLPLVYGPIPYSQ